MNCNTGRWRFEGWILAVLIGIFTIMAATVAQNGKSGSPMDDLDRALIVLLRHSARRGISDLAGDLKVSRATVRSRMERLEREGEIRGYTVVLKADGGALPVRGITMIAVEERSTDKVVRSLGGFPGVSAIHSTLGRWDLIAELGAESLTAFDDLLRRLRLIPGITGTETSLLLATPRSTKAAM
jgi:DNA-binding Lrp family transcriptional regulator